MGAWDSRRRPQPGAGGEQDPGFSRWGEREQQGLTTSQTAQAIPTSQAFLPPLLGDGTDTGSTCRHSGQPGWEGQLPGRSWRHTVPAGRQTLPGGFFPRRIISGQLGAAGPRAVGRRGLGAGKAVSRLTGAGRLQVRRCGRARAALFRAGRPPLWVTRRPVLCLRHSQALPTPPLEAPATRSSCQPGRCVDLSAGPWGSPAAVGAAGEQGPGTGGGLGPGSCFLPLGFQLPVGLVRMERGPAPFGAPTRLWGVVGTRLPALQGTEARPSFRPSCAPGRHGADRQVRGHRSLTGFPLRPARTRWPSCPSLRPGER